jgi:hypothetical protein
MGLGNALYKNVDLEVSADMFERVNKKLLIHPFTRLVFYEVSLQIPKRGGTHSDGGSC